jgi:hypothetical protein
MKRFLSIFLSLLLCASVAGAATLRYSENFDDGDIDQPVPSAGFPNVGNISVFQRFGAWNITSEKYRFEPGYSGLALTDNTVRYGGNADWRSTSLDWTVNATWPTDEIYISWYERYLDPFNPIYQNTKLYYIFYNPSNLTDRDRAAIERGWNGAGGHLGKQVGGATYLVCWMVVGTM